MAQYDEITPQRWRAARSRRTPTSYGKQTRSRGRHYTDMTASYGHHPTVLPMTGPATDPSSLHLSMTWWCGQQTCVSLGFDMSRSPSKSTSLSAGVPCTPSDASGPPRVCWDTVGEPLASRWCSPARPTGAGGDVPGGLGGCRPRRLCGRQRPAAQASRPTWQLWQLAGMAATVATTPRRCRRWTLRLPQPPHRQRAPARGRAGRRQPRAEARRPLVWAAPAQPTVDYGRRCGALPCPSCCSRPPRPSATQLSPFSGPSPFHAEPTPPPLRILSSRVRLPQPSVKSLLPASPTGADQQRPQAATARCQSVCQVAPGAGVRHEVSSRHAPAAMVSRPAPKDWASKGPSLPVPLRPAPSPPHQARGPPKGARRASARTPRQSRPGSVGGSGRRQTARWHPPPHTQRPVRGSHP